MTVIAVQEGVRVAPVNDYQFIGRTVIAGETLTSGLMVKLDPTTGYLDEATQSDMPYGLLVTDAQSGEPGFVLRWGIVDGFDVSGLNFGVSVYTGVDGVLEDTMKQEGEPLADVAVIVGKVVSNSELGVKLVEFRFM